MPSGYKREDMSGPVERPGPGTGKTLVARAEVRIYASTRRVWDALVNPGDYPALHVRDTCGL